LSPFFERPFAFNEGLHLDLRAESFNVFNHANFVGYRGAYGNGPAPGPGFGQQLAGITDQLLPRSIQFIAKLVFLTCRQKCAKRAIFAYYRLHEQMDSRAFAACLRRAWAANPQSI
jgi:hypothetical protein